MKKMFLLLIVVPTIAFADSLVCNFEEGQYTNKMTIQVDTDGVNYTITFMGEILDKCDSLAFDKGVADELLQSKLNTVFYDNVEKTREIYGNQVKQATGGLLVMCQVDSVVSLGVIVNDTNSFAVLHGGSAYFDMTKGQCK